MFQRGNSIVADGSRSLDEVAGLNPPPATWVSVLSVVYGQVEVSEMADQSSRRVIPNMAVPDCDLKISIMWRLRPTMSIYPLKRGVDGVVSC